MTNQVVTPSETITPGQVGKIQELLGAALRKSGLPNAPVQHVLEFQGNELVADLVSEIRTRVEKVANLIVRRVTAVDRIRSGQQALDATGRTQYTDGTVVDAMPRGDGAEAEVIFFKVGRYASDDEVEKEYDLRDLKPADPFALAKVNQDDPAFADEHPNGTHWKNADGRWCFASFRRWHGRRNVSVDRDDDVWHDFWWFAGVRK